MKLKPRSNIPLICNGDRSITIQFPPYSVKFVHPITRVFTVARLFVRFVDLQWTIMAIKQLSVEYCGEEPFKNLLPLTWPRIPHYEIPAKWILTIFLSQSESNPSSSKVCSNYIFQYWGFAELTDGKSFAFTSRRFLLPANRADRQNRKNENSSPFSTFIRWYGLFEVCATSHHWCHAYDHCYF